MNFNTTTPAPTPSPKVTDEPKFRTVRDENTGTHVTLAQIKASAEVGDVFGLTKLGGKQGFALKRVYEGNGAFGTVSGMDAVTDWTDAQLARLVYVGKREAVQPKAAREQAPKARAKSRARKARKSAKAPERTAAQHAATLRMLDAKNTKGAASYRAKHGLA